MKYCWSLLSAVLVAAVMILFGSSLHAADKARPRTQTHEKSRPHSAPRTVAPPRDRHDSHPTPQMRHPEPHRYDQYRHGPDRHLNLYPRHYGLRYFSHRYYRGHRFGPHFRIWTGSFWFYWQYYDAPLMGCGYYWVPTQRLPVIEPDGQEYWQYFDYRYERLCFD